MVLSRDYALGWSHVPVFIVLFGDALVAAGLVLIWLVFRVNPFAAAAVTVETEQPVISRGLLRSSATPSAAEVCWCCSVFRWRWDPRGGSSSPPYLVLIILRLTNEERCCPPISQGTRLLYQGDAPAIPSILVNRRDRRAGIFFMIILKVREPLWQLPGHKLRKR